MYRNNRTESIGNKQAAVLGAAAQTSFIILDPACYIRNVSLHLGDVLKVKLFTFMDSDRLPVFLSFYQSVIKASRYATVVGMVTVWTPSTVVGAII